MAITPESALIMKLLGMGAAELDIPARYSMFEEVASFFGTDSSSRQRILKIIQKNPAKDSLETIWRYVRLENEKKEAIKALDPAEFVDDISDEIKQGYLTIASERKIREDIERREKRLTKQKEINDADSPVVKEAMKVHEVKQKLDIVKEINGALSYFNG